jgi:hypothetical protein
MTLLPRGVKVHLAFGFIDMRKGIDVADIEIKAVDHLSTADFPRASRRHQIGATSSRRLFKRVEFSAWNGWWTHLALEP